MKRIDYLVKIQDQLLHEGIGSDRLLPSNVLEFRPPNPHARVYVDVVPVPNDGLFDSENVIEISAKYGDGESQVLAEYNADTHISDAVAALRLFTGH